MEKITIENFGPIVHADIDIRDINIFIGTTSSGKSTVAKLILIFRGEFPAGGGDPVFFNRRLANYDIDFRVTDKTRLRYQLNQCYYEVTKDRIENNFSTSSAEHLNPIYIPVERISFPVISQSISGLISNKIALPKWFLDFCAEFEKARNAIKNISIDFLNVSYFYSDSHDYITLSDGCSVRLSQASSGLQSVIPLILVVQYNTNQKKPKDVYVIEEPELNLYPSSQKDLTEFIVQCAQKSKSRLIITTYSPYLLTTLDNLIQANNVVALHHNMKQEVSKLVSEKYWIGYDQVSCYFFENGNARSTMDNETKSIGPSNIDNVSERLSDTFEKLLVLKYP